MTLSCLKHVKRESNKSIRPPVPKLYTDVVFIGNGRLPTWMGSAFIKGGGQFVRDQSDLANKTDSNHQNPYQTIEGRYRMTHQHNKFS